MNTEQLKAQINHDILFGEFWILFADASGMESLKEFAREFFDGKPGDGFDILLLDEAFGMKCSEISPPITAVGFASKRRMPEKTFKEWCREHRAGLLYRGKDAPFPFGTILTDNDAGLCEKVFDWFESEPSEPNIKPSVNLN